MTRGVQDAAATLLRLLVVLLTPAVLVAAGRRAGSVSTRTVRNPSAGWSSFADGPATRTQAGATVAAENDILRGVIGVVTRLHPLLTRTQAATIRATLAGDFAAIAARPELERLPSLLLNGPGRAYVYVPPHAAGAKLPLVVVCHGHGGNPFVGCLPWEDLADDLGFVAAFPTFGYGNWEHPDAAAAILRCRKAVTERFAVDGRRAVLAGISQGGFGVTRAATAAPWAGLVYVSPTMEPHLFNAAFAASWRGRPVLVAHGGRDINVKPRTVDAAVATLRSLGVVVTHVRDPDADHFYFFEKRAAFADHFRQWWLSEARHAG